jgi:hypothetical protein
MIFEQSDAESVINRLKAMSDETGAVLLRQMHALWGWGPDTEWDCEWVCEDESSKIERGGDVVTLLGLALERKNAAWLNVLAEVVPPSGHPDRWKSALSVCMSAYLYDAQHAQVAGVFKQTTPRSALQCAWKSSQAWAVVPLLKIKKELHAFDAQDTWAEQIVQASEGLGLLERKSARNNTGVQWLPFWETLKQAAPLMGIHWPGPSEDWQVGNFKDHWLKPGTHAWDSVALMLDTPGMLEASWTESCGHGGGALPLVLNTLPDMADDTFSRLLVAAIEQSAPRAEKCLDWMMSQSDVLMQTPKGLPTSYCRETWKETIMAGASDVTQSAAAQQSYVFALTVLRNLARHDPILPPRRPRVRS